MKVGDRVKVISLVEDDYNTNLAIGMKGTIKRLDCCNDGYELDVFIVDFDKAIYSDDYNPNLSEDDTYQVYRNQLRLIRPRRKKI